MLKFTLRNKANLGVYRSGLDATVLDAGRRGELVLETSNVFLDATCFVDLLPAVLAEFRLSMVLFADVLKA